MSFSVSFWNVENFSGGSARARKVESHVRALTESEDPPDVIGFCEVKDKTLMRDLITRNFQEYDFAMSDTAIVQKGERKTQIEILVGWRAGVFDQVMYTQRIELTAGRISIRPGVLLNVRVDRDWYSLLLLHTKSGPKTNAFNVRQKQFDQMFKLKRKLDRIEPGNPGKDKARLIVVGDLNTMGNGYRGRPNPVSGAEEIHALRAQAGRNRMKMEFKEFADTFNQRSPRKLRSNLDHVLTTPRVTLKMLGHTEDGDPFTVRVSGWNQLLDDRTALHRFEDELSDHSALYFEVET